MVKWSVLLQFVCVLEAPAKTALGQSNTMLLFFKQLDIFTLWKKERDWQTISNFHKHTHNTHNTHTHTHHTHTHTHTTHTHVGFYGLRGLSIGVMVFILYKLYVLLPYTYPTPKLSPHRRRCISTFPQKTLSVWFISVLNYGDTENVLINHLLLVIPMSYPCYYTNLCPHKPHKHVHTHTPHNTPHHTPHTHIHTHTHTHTFRSFRKQ